MPRRERSPLVLIAPVPSQHRVEMFDLIAKVFSHSGYYTFRESLRASYLDHSHYDWFASRIGLMDGKIVSHFGVWDYLTRIGAARLRTGGIGVVATDGDYRKHGLMRLTAQGCIDAMREQGYDLSVLFGIQNFYHRFGYTRAWVEQTYIVATADLPVDKPAVTLRRFRFGPRAEFDSLFNQQHQHITGTAVRPTYSRANPRHQRIGYVWRDRQGKPLGYFAVADKGAHLEVIEAVGDTDQLLRGIGQVARKWRAREVRFVSLPYRTDLACRLRAGSVRLECSYARCGGPMVRIVNLRSSLTKMEVELTRRLKASVFQGRRAQLVLSDGRESVALGLGGGRVKVLDAPVRGGAKHAILAGDALGQLLLGTDEPGQIVADRDIKVTGDARELLPVLFPAQYPMLHTADRF